MSITAKELAQKLGLSAAAVSIALNNKPGVSRQTRQMVLDAAEREGYDFSRISAKGKASGSLYFVLYKRHGAVVADTPFFSQLSDGISEGCKDAGYKMNTRYIYDDESTFQKQIEDIQYSDCCGILLLGTEMTANDFKPFQKLPVPIVLLDTYFETVEADYVLINNVQGAFLAASYLIKRTGRQPGYLHSSYSIGNFEKRASGFYNAIRAGGMSPSKSIVHRLTPSIEGAFSDMMEILERGEELAGCYFADNDLIALGAMRALKAKGYRIPEDISIVGFDNISSSSIVEPSLTTIHVPKREMGILAVERMVSLLERKKTAPVKIEVFTRLVKRRSA